MWIKVTDDSGQVTMAIPLNEKLLAGLTHEELSGVIETELLMVGHWIVDDLVARSLSPGTPRIQ